MSHRRRSNGSDEYSSESDDDTNFKRRRQRSHSPDAASTALRDPAAGPLRHGDGTDLSGQQSGVQGMPIPTADFSDRPRARREDIRFDRQQRRPGNDGYWGQGPRVGDRRNMQGGRGPYNMLMQPVDMHGGVEPYVPEYTPAAFAHQRDANGMGLHSHQQHHPMANMFRDMPAPAMPLPLPFMPILGGGPGMGMGGPPSMEPYQNGLWEKQGKPPFETHLASAPQTAQSRQGWVGPMPSRNPANSLHAGEPETSTGEDIHQPYQPQPVSQGGRGWGQQQREVAPNLNGTGDRLPRRGRATCTIHLMNLPDSQDLKPQLYRHFGKFGQVVHIRIRASEIPGKGSLAWVQLADRAQAESALASPEAVLGNRFVRMEWAARDVVDGTVHASNGSSKLQKNTEPGHVAPGRGQPPFGPPGGVRPPPPPPPSQAKPQASEADPSSESADKVKELEKTTELLAKQIAEQKRMLALLEAKKRPAPALATASEDAGPPSGDQFSPRPTKAQKIIKGDSKTTVVSASSPHGRSALGVGGRGSTVGHRGRGRWAPGSGRGWSRLDTRNTTAVKIVELPEGIDLHSIRAHFETFGQITSAELEDTSGARIVFETRRQAEAALIGGKKIGEHSLILQWATTSSLPPVAASPRTIARRGLQSNQKPTVVPPQNPSAATPVPDAMPGTAPESKERQGSKSPGKHVEEGAGSGDAASGEGANCDLTGCDESNGEDLRADDDADNKSPAATDPGSHPSAPDEILIGDFDSDGGNEADARLRDGSTET